MFPRKVINKCIKGCVHPESVPLIRGKYVHYIKLHSISATMDDKTTYY